MVWRESATRSGVYDASMQLICDAVMFDRDGVLVDSHLDGHRAWTQLSSEFGFGLTDEVFAELAGIRPADSLARFLPECQLHEAATRLEDLEVSLAASTDPLPGAVGLLTSLGVDGWAIVTSAGRRLALARWAGAAVPIPRIVVAAEDVTLGKPDPEPYLVGARALGVDASECVVFEDSPSGAAAAFEAGAKVIAVGDQPWPVQPAARVRDLDDVLITKDSEQRLVITLTPAQ